MRFAFYATIFLVGVFLRHLWDGFGAIAESLNVDKPYQ